MTPSSARKPDDGGRVGSKTMSIAAPDFLYCQPLVQGLTSVEGVSLRLLPAGEVVEQFAYGDVDAAMLPSIELQRQSVPPVILAVGCVASTGPSLTTRVFSHIRPEALSTMWVDDQSRSSVALAQVLWANCYGRRLETVPYAPVGQDSPDDAQALLIIGDHVVSDPPIGYDWQIDLSAMWHEMTGLPFVFSVWAARPGKHCQRLARVLSQARCRGMERIVEIAHEQAITRDWPVDMAVTYLTRRMLFDFTPAAREGLEEFFEFAAECDLIDEVVPLEYIEAQE